jgi:hypothetical protein
LTRAFIARRREKCALRTGPLAGGLGAANHPGSLRGPVPGPNSGRFIYRIQTGIRGNPGVSPKDECAHSPAENLVNLHIHPIPEMIIPGLLGAGVINWHLRD